MYIHLSENIINKTVSISSNIFFFLQLSKLNRRFNFFSQIKGTVSVISSDPSCKDCNENFYTTKQTPRNLNLIKNVEETVVFLTKFLRCFIYEQGMRNHFRRLTAIPSWSEKAFKGTVVNRALPSLHGGSLEKTQNPTRIMEPVLLFTLLDNKF